MFGETQDVRIWEGPERLGLERLRTLELGEAREVRFGETQDVRIGERPEELGLDDHDEELATFGGLITRELGKIPKRNETIRFPSFDAKVLNADETRVLDAEVSLLPSPKSE